MTAWEIKGREFGNCNCDYGCPCQFNALPTHGHCRGLAVFDIEAGFHGTTRLDGLRAAGIFRWPGPIHEGKGEGVHIIDKRATPEQREALLRILRGEDTEPGATVFQRLRLDLRQAARADHRRHRVRARHRGRTARAHIEGVLEMRGAPILNPVTGAEHRVRIVQPNGFEFAEAEIGRGWSKTARAGRLRTRRQLWAIRSYPSLPKRHGALKPMSGTAVERCSGATAWSSPPRALALTLLAWLFLFAGAGTGMDPVAMSGWLMPFQPPAQSSGNWTARLLARRILHVGRS